jgi:hypothetical protein
MEHGRDHRSSRGVVLDEALPRVLTAPALAHRVSRIDGPELRDRYDAHDGARR